MKETDNEITIRILCSKEDIVQLLKSKGCTFDRKFRLDDTYFVSADIDLKALPRDLLTGAIILRINTEGSKSFKELTFKIKDFAEDGSIISQQKYNCEIVNGDDARDFLEAAGYKELLHIIEDDLVFLYDGIGLVVKDVAGLGLLMEIETREGSKYEDIESLKKLVEDLGIPMQEGEFFIKKAEECITIKELN